MIAILDSKNPFKFDLKDYAFKNHIIIKRIEPINENPIIHLIKADGSGKKCPLDKELPMKISISEWMPSHFESISNCKIEYDFK